MRAKLTNFRKLSPTDRSLFLQAIFLLPFTELRIRYSNFKKTLNSLNQPGQIRQSPFHSDDQALTQARRTAGLVRKAAGLCPFPIHCLARSLVLWHLLHRQKIPAEICIGVKKMDPHQDFGQQNFEAHAWIVCQGQVLDDEPGISEQYIVLSNDLPLGR